jgi:hypothetical protein
MTYRIRRSLITLSRVLFFALLFQLNTAGAQEDDKCSDIDKDIVEASTQGTASLFANEGNKPGSIRYESGAILEKADSGLSSAEKPAGLCPAGCVLPAKPVIVFRAVPTAFVTNYSDYDKCQKLLEETEKTPFEYNESFSSMSEVESWFSDFSRGKGTDGQDLYKRCSGQCSPQYEFFITSDGGKLALDADVVCGHARDKSNNMYDISYSYKWICQSK